MSTTKEKNKYTKEELLALLEEKGFPLVELPRPETFEWRQGHSAMALHVGYMVTKISRKVKEKLWLEEADTRAQARGGEAPAPALGEAATYSGQRGDWPAGQDIQYFSFHYGAKAKNETNLQKTYQGLFYTADDGRKVNNEVKNAKGYLGSGMFASNNLNGIVTPFSQTIKSLYRFALVYTGQSEYFEEFDTKGKPIGVRMLVGALRKLPRKAEEDEKNANDDEEEEEDEEEEDY